MNTNKRAFHEQIADNLIEQLKQGTAPWQKPWKPGDPLLILPNNPSTDKRYRGINTVHLMSQGRSDPRWMTYKQAASQGAQVRKGEKSTQVQYWKFYDERIKTDNSGKPVLDRDNKPIKEQVRLERPGAFYASVFNAEQIDNLPKLEIKAPDWEPIDRAEQILQASNAVIHHGQNDKAFYRSSSDEIHLPHKEQFQRPDQYYATALHELGHWTGHESRLNRDLGNPFGSQAYAKEELRAEIASMIMGSELGIGHDPGQHAAYVDSWIKVLAEDPKEIFRAAADAEKIQDYVLSLSLKQDIVEQEEIKTNQINQQTASAGFIAMRNDPDQQKRNSEMENKYEQGKAIQDSYPTDEPDEAAQEEEREIFYASAYQLTLEEVAILKRAGREPVPVPLYEDIASYSDYGEDYAFDMLKQDRNKYEEQAEFLDKVKKDSRQYLVVPYQEKDLAKAAGANWDNTAKSWFVGEDADIRALQRWFPENASKQQEPSMEPRAEFAELLRSHGCIVDGDHPVMDGAKQRIKVEGDKVSEKSGFYVGHLDGHPAGYFKNNRSGIETNWKAKGYLLTDEQKAELSAQAAIQQQNRKVEQHDQQLKVARAIKELLIIAPLANAEHPYLLDKNARPGTLKIVPESTDGLPEGSIIKIGKDWKEAKALRESNPDSIVFTAGDLLLPALDIEGNLWSVQTIQPSGAKFFATGSRKENNFYVVDNNNQGLAALDNADAIIIAEGYATADTLSEVLDYPVVAAFDSGNLSKVAQVLHEKYPHKSIIIAGDDDFIQESVNGKNPGKEKALEVAELVNGVTVFPIFAPGEQISQKLSDFNDLANKSTLGVEGIKRQVGSVVKKSLEKAKDQAKVEKLQYDIEVNKQNRAVVR